MIYNVNLQGKSANTSRDLNKGLRMALGCVMNDAGSLQVKGTQGITSR